MKHCLISCLRALQRAAAALQLTCLALLALQFPAIAQEGSGSSRQTQTCGDKDAGITLPPDFCATVFADNVGHARRVAEISAMVRAVPNLHVSGNFLKGRSIGDCTDVAFRVAEDLHSHIEGELI